MAKEQLTDWLFGRPLASGESEDHKITTLGGIPVLGLDALSSAAYGPEAALTILLSLGAAGLAHIGPLIGLILLLLGILFFSYRQTIHAYPSGGGSYIVAKENLGTMAGLFAAAALLLDYVLTVAVGISAGVGALVSAVPALHPHILALCLATLALVTIVNLRGVRESGAFFAIPTYAFLGSLLCILAYGVYQAIVSGGHPVPVAPPPALPIATAVAAPWLLMKAFASGCTAMTGVEAVSNGIQAFAKPRVAYAQKTLAAIVVLLALLLAGIAYLCTAYHVGATDPDSAAYQSVLSSLVAAIVGRGPLYYITLGSVISVLALSANTGFADFPRLCQLIAADEFLPRFFTVRGRRLVYSSGILILALTCGALLIAFRGITDRLIPLFAIGAFLAFTLSQAGMVQHWRRNQTGGWRSSLAINLFGAICTGVTLVVVLVAKFADGAWITVLLIPIFVICFVTIHHHYRDVAEQITCGRPFDVTPATKPVVLVPYKGWNSVSERAIRFAMTISDDVIALHVADETADTLLLSRTWDDLVATPIRDAGRTPPELRLVNSPYRRFIGPTLDAVRDMRKTHPGRDIAVVVPELVESHWADVFLHNQRANLLRAALLLTGGTNVVIVTVPWYLHDRGQ